MSDIVPLPAEALLEGVPRVGYDVHHCPLPGCLYACFEYLVDPVEYDFLMGVSGACFRRLFEKNDGGNVDLMYFAPEPHERVFAAVGYAFETVGDDPAAMREAVTRGIGRGVPVIALGVIGPPEACLVTGYEEGGRVLRGWNYFQEQPATEYYRAEGWEPATRGMILVGEPLAERPDDRRTAVESLRWAVELTRMERWHGTHSAGLAAYAEWADGLEIQADWTADDLETIHTRCMVHCDQVVMTYERGNAARYLRGAAAQVPEAADPLEAAAALYEQIGLCAGDLWPFRASWDDPVVRKAMAEPERREAMAAIVRRCGLMEAEAIEHLEAALGAVGA